MASPHPYETIAHAIRWLQRHQAEQPRLSELAREIGQSESHLQRTFTAWAGVSPKQFLKYLSKEHALERLRRGATVLDSAYDIGLSSPGRLHDLLVTTEALTPGEARRGGLGVTFEFGHGPSPFGDTVVAWNERGIAFLGFATGRDRRSVTEEMRAQWPRATWQANAGAAQERLRLVFDPANEEAPRLWLRGSPFQLKVWEALLRIPAGACVTYGQLASHLGNGRAARAVGAAVGRNPVAWLIPCHRVIARTAGIGGYRWGVEAKCAMLAAESAQSRTTSSPERR